jgi:rhodanese-related sulfurtransferase
MAYTKKFQQLADAAIASVTAVMPEDLDAFLTAGGVALDIRDKEEHDVDHIAGSLHLSRGKLEMNIEEMIPKIDTSIVCYCNANNRGALSADTLQSMGYTNAKYIKGGLKAYRALKTN